MTWRCETHGDRERENAPAALARSLEARRQYVAGFWLETVTPSPPPEICFNCSGESFLSLEVVLDEVLVVSFDVFFFI
jgi:hypothetical protein